MTEKAEKSAQEGRSPCRALFVAGAALLGVVLLALAAGAGALASGWSGDIDFALGSQ